MRRILKTIKFHLLPNKECSYEYKLRRIICNTKYFFSCILFKDHALSMNELIARNRGDPKTPLNRSRTKHAQTPLLKASEFISNEAGDMLNKKILDIGARDGRFLEELQSRGARNLHGIEIVPEWVEECHRLGLKFVQQGNFLDFNIENNTFDIVFSRHTLEHVDKPVEFFSKIKGVTKPGGTIVIIFPLNPVPNFKHPSRIPSLDWVKNNFDLENLDLNYFGFINNSDNMMIRELRDPSEGEEVLIWGKMKGLVSTN